MNTKTLIFRIFLSTSLLATTAIFGQSALAQITATTLPQSQQITTPPVNCTFVAPVEPAKAEYKARFLAVRKKGAVQPGEFFTMQIFVQNISNVPWFSEDSGCNSSTIVHLGTEKDRDRFSPFYTREKNPDTAANTWSGPARIKMNNKRVDQFELATFTITAKAPQEPGIYREFYAPVAEGVTWMEGEALFSININVGNASLDPATSNYLTYIQKSANLSEIKLEGDKKITVDLSDQRMYVNIGDTNIRTFPVSTGAPKHPTPPGSYKIFLKQPVRIGGASPHYIMPYYQMFKAGGYGIHALPSLGNDHGVFWREAFDHIGSPKSHGCVRLLPDDAQFVWDFTELGTEMTIQK